MVDTVVGGHSRVLNSIAPDLKTLVDVEALLPYLLQHQLVTVDEEFYLRNVLYSSSTRAQMLLGYLKHKGDGSLQLFLCSLNLAHEHKGHRELADKLKRQLQATGISYADFCPACATSSAEIVTTEELGKLPFVNLTFICCLLDDHNRVLDLIAPDVIALVNVEVLLPFLQQHQLVTADEESYLSSLMYSSRQKARWLLCFIKHKGDGALQLLLCCLHLAHEHKGHKDLADKLKRHMQVTGISYADFCPACATSSAEIGKLLFII